LLASEETMPNQADKAYFPNATAMRERCDFHRSSIAIGNAVIDYTVFIPLSQHRTRIAVAIGN
jgi:hypothetical protein